MKPLSSKFLFIKIGTTLVGLMLLTVSCKMVYNSFNGVNKMTTFNNKEEYLKYFEKRFNFHREDIYFPEKEEYGNLMNYISNQKVSFFYGITVNENSKIYDSYLNDNNSCFGRIVTIIKNRNFEHKLTGTEITKFKFENINSKTIDFNNGKSVIFIISTKLGRAINNNIKELTCIIDDLNDKSINYYLISVDNQDFKNPL